MKEKKLPCIRCSTHALVSAREKKVFSVAVGVALTICTKKAIAAVKAPLMAKMQDAGIKLSITF